MPRWRFNADEQKATDCGFRLYNRGERFCLNSASIVTGKSRAPVTLPGAKRIKGIPLGRFRYCDYDIEFWSTSVPLYLPCSPTLYAYNVENGLPQTSLRNSDMRNMRRVFSILLRSNVIKKRTRVNISMFEEISRR